ncbi:GSCOCG00009262001-RA-CDS, partial [Cotesia congregata]
IVKKGEGSKVEEYRGVTLTQTAYKVYVGILEKRMRID